MLSQWLQECSNQLVGALTHIRSSRVNPASRDHFAKRKTRPVDLVLVEDGLIPLRQQRTGRNAQTGMQRAHHRERKLSLSGENF
jgi:hypothetical protein